jgi:hypothetical protein
VQHPLERMWVCWLVGGSWSGEVAVRPHPRQHGTTRLRNMRIMARYSGSLVGRRVVTAADLTHLAGDCTRFVVAWQSWCGLSGRVADAFVAGAPFPAFVGFELSGAAVA